MEQRERNIRAAIAWRLFDMGNAITRAARKVCDDIPTVESESTESWGWGHRLGLRDGLGDGMAAAFAACQHDSSEGDGPTAALVYCVARDAGLDGGYMIQRVADAARALEPAR